MFCNCNYKGKNMSDLDLLAVEAKTNTDLKMCIRDRLGYEQKRPGYKHRRSYMYENILFEIDTWDEQTYTKPYLEIEVTSDEELEKAIVLLNLDRSQITTKPIDCLLYTSTVLPMKLSLRMLN